jgi:hypothetical protein
MKCGKPVIVTSQPAIKGEYPTPAALDGLMQVKRFEKLADGAYYGAQGGLLIFESVSAQRDPGCGRTYLSN